MQELMDLYINWYTESIVFPDAFTWLQYKMKICHEVHFGAWKIISQVRPMLNATRNVTRVHILAVQLKYAYPAAFIDYPNNFYKKSVCHYSET